MVRQWEGMTIIPPSRQIMGFIHMGRPTHVTILTNAYQVFTHLPFLNPRYLHCMFLREPANHDRVPLTCRNSISSPKARLRCIMEATLNHWTTWNLQVARLRRI